MPTTLPIEVREAALSDLDTIAAFNAAMAAETEQRALDPALVTAGVREGLEDPEKCLYFVAEAEGRVVGQAMVTLEWSDWRDAYFWWLQSVYVDQAHRRRGVFRALYQYVRTLAIGRPDVCGLRLYVHADNERAIETYRRLGMVVTDYRVCEEDWSSE